MKKPEPAMSMMTLRILRLKSYQSTRRTQETTNQAATTTTVKESHSLAKSAVI